ncbi:aminoglycoside N(3)-acetyltransferase [Cognatishimia sp. MH4019]|uniref:aminoglycoside N(3)-acetyltransferase n=1 Tax=Cognatishimia sp. MH4019 TaxID=2854030 RepID=UPI001CD3F9F0|nr:AAC(3) family N-acetyltransferase [Cognatishimia sp. MH4019]
MQDAPMQVFGTDDLVDDLHALGLQRGDGVFVHCALGQIGHVIGGPRGVIEALIKTVGDMGLIGMPGFSTDAYDPSDTFGITLSEAEHARIRAQVPGFDKDRSNVSANGAVAEGFRTWPGVVRSPHPTTSVLLFGKDAEEHATPHDPAGWATGPETPWGHLMQRPDMKILLIGVGWNRCSALHAAESLAPHKRTKTRHFKDAATGEWTTAPDVADDRDRLFPLVGTDWEKDGTVTQGKLGNALCRVTGYKELVTYAAEWINTRNQADGVAAG